MNAALLSINRIVFQNTQNSIILQNKKEKYILHRQYFEFQTDY